jgi:hypothetical protein
MTFQQFKRIRTTLVSSILLLAIGPLGAQAKRPAQTARPQRLAESALIEQFSFVIKDFKMSHQSQDNNLNISVHYRYAAGILNADYPDFRWLEKDIETMLNNYPNETDCWELVNKQMTSMLLKKYRSLASVTIEIEVTPSSVVPFLRSSKVTRNGSSK